MKSKLGIAAVALTALTLGLSAVAAEGSTAYVVTGTKAIGGYRVGGTYAQAQRSFGGSYSTTQTNTTCTARWKNGVTIVWDRKLPATKWARACTRFRFAKVGSGKPKAAWRTDKGLRVGASPTQLKKLYHAATSKRSKSYTIWTLTKTPTVSLQAWVTKGRVAYFRLARS